MGRAVAPLLAVLLVALGVALWSTWNADPPPTAMDVPAAVVSPAPQRHDNRLSPAFSIAVALRPVTEGPQCADVSWTGAPDDVSDVLLFRSTRPLQQTALDEFRYPVTRERVESSSFVDDHLADGVDYYYQVAARDRAGRWTYSDVKSVRTPARALTAMSSPSIFVDKRHYILEVRDGEAVVKRYPIALGRNPFKRKLHQDNASTPEGSYRIVGLQPDATFHRAYDIDYPNRSDRLRYEVARDSHRLPSHGPAIGGEIQIHGKGIHANWTFGCIALRNTDMDELFTRAEIARGTRVRISGAELTASDIDAMERANVTEVRQAQTRLVALGFYRGPLDGLMGRRTMHALGVFQISKGLPLTCDIDTRTSAALK